MDASLNIVIVDDSPVRAAILEEGLREAGYVNVVRIEGTVKLLARDLRPRPGRHSHRSRKPEP